MLKEGFKFEMLGIIYRCNICDKEMFRVVFFSYKSCCLGWMKVN